MNQRDKDGLLQQAKANLQRVRKSIQVKLKETVEVAQNIKTKLYSLPPSEQLAQSRILSTYEQRSQKLDALYPSPYFVKCEIKFDGESVSRIFYFSKFTLPEEDIYSWTAPASAIRFEKPGKFSYPIKDVGDKAGELISKEQYMITDGRIIFMAAESLTQPRELIYQEYFSQRKSTFVLPEIVEQMEKAQDKVIRANPQGSFLISGPAGSGKTTLALHRVAYLIQSPDTAENFTESNVIVFVQDQSTGEYFSQLLPQLGINNVTITTFSHWAREHLKLYEFKYTIRYGQSEQQKDIYEYQKYQAIQKVGNLKYTSNIFELLNQTYVHYLDSTTLSLFKQQQRDGILDRFDLTVLLQAYINSNKNILKEDIEYKQLKGGKVQRKKVFNPLKYSLMILDEVQNYLPGQVSILRSCIDEKFNSIVYVGDLAQQTQLCTIRDWKQAGEQIAEDRKVVLQKNYRSTKQILQYIRDLGYPIDVPENIKTGEEVKELRLPDTAAEIKYVKEIIKNNPKVVVGILSKSADYLQVFKEQIIADTNVHILTINEAQGVEFDVVCLVGMDQEFFAVNPSYDESLQQERKRVDKDLLYVALTRAMNELHILGKKPLTDIIVSLRG